METKYSKKDIAIVGISARFPKSSDINEFWKRIVNEEELSHFYSKDELEKAEVDPKLISDRNYVNVGSTIEDPDTFDHTFFGYTKDEAMMMDPQIRIMHEQVWHGLEDAGSVHTNRYKVGLFLSACDNVNWRIYAELANKRVDPFFLSHISNKSFISTLIAYKLNLKGPSYYSETACSSSMISLHLACRSLLMKECKVAVAGGVRVSSTPDLGYIYREGFVYSRDGKCRSFDNKADGTYAGEGAAVVVLKRLEDAMNDGDRIYGIVKGSAVNNDGSRKVGYTAPSVAGITECIKMSHKIAGVESSSISYVETHGAATNLGDPIEIEALNNAFGHDTNHKCGVGSVKSNMGHLDAAAGVAGFIKATLSLYNRTIPASLNYKVPNEEIDFESGPFYVHDKTSPWKFDGPLRAGVNAIGIGGTNGHFVLEEAPIIKSKPSSRKYMLIPYSAKNDKSLELLEKDMSQFLSNNLEIELSDFAYTMQTGRSRFENTKFIVGAEHIELVSQLNSSEHQNKLPTASSNDKKVIFMFPGQGSQYQSMAADLYHEEPYFRKIIDDGLIILAEKSDIKFKTLLGYWDNQSHQDEINKTENAQPLLFLIEYALAKTLIHFGIKPDCLIGHSLGEYVAACIAGGISLEEGLSIAILRGKLMGESDEGAMMSVSMSALDIQPLLEEGVVIGAINSPESTVLSGGRLTIEKMAAKLEANSIDHKILKISIASHSPLMDNILAPFKSELEKIQFRELQTTVISNLEGSLMPVGEVLDADYWCKHLRQGVQFLSGIETALDFGKAIFIEVGPGRTLSTFLRQQKDFGGQSSIVNLIRHPKDEIDDRIFFLNGLGTIWAQGIDINWDSYYDGEKRVKTSAPKYPFVQNRFTAIVNPMKYFEGGVNNILEIEAQIKEESTNSEDQLSDSSRDHLTSKYHEPVTKFEKDLAALYEDFFRMDKVGIHDDFFELGGDSLKAMTLTGIILKDFDININITDFFENLTIKKLAEHMENVVHLDANEETENSLII